ncbi:Imm32 family immunity protein [Kiloniella sp.]|uniref:Imm32 family immunity protein n=1 Tax=Kiloniella sp. TaxID=1938587 RepID=UPI003B01F53E
MSKIHVVCDGDWERPEVQISGSSMALSQLGILLSGINSHRRFSTNNSIDEIYAINIPTIILTFLDIGNDRLTVGIDQNSLRFSGTKKAFDILGDSLVNFFDDQTVVGEHFHLDYYEGNEVLNDTTCHLIFMCNR